jgi:hypothetical protein
VDETMVSKQYVKKLLGKQIYALKKDGSVLEGKLLQISGSKLILANKDKKVKTSAFVPLVLFDLLAIGTRPFEFERFPFEFERRREFEFESPFFRRDFF